MGKNLFTSESVTEGHPDKICDQISDAILDAIIAKDPTARVACETTVTTGIISIMGEITTNAVVDYGTIARETVREIGYDRAKYGFDCDTCAVVTSIDKQPCHESMIEILGIVIITDSACKLPVDKVLCCRTISRFQCMY